MATPSDSGATAVSAGPTSTGPVLSPTGSDEISPKSQAPSTSTDDSASKNGYFPQNDDDDGSGASTPTATEPGHKRNRPRIRILGHEFKRHTLSRGSTSSNATITRPKLDIPDVKGHSSVESISPVNLEVVRGGRKGSVASLSFAQGHPSLPQGTHKQRDKGRIRAGSPPPKRFQSHVAFDNLPLGEATKSNTTSLTLNVRHRGYQAKRRSRTFMVGVDEHAYSDYALQWLLDELVDDGDEIVCVRVVEKDSRTLGPYQDDAKRLIDSIVEKNGNNRAISVILEYAVGKLHSTFQKLIHMYQPSMLIVGTRGRSLGGLQGLVNTRNSFSKYCLQYSPIPVVVVRPTEKREKKKSKRLHDTERRTYVRMLSATGGKHESDSEKTSMYEVEVKYSADEEAHQVAKVLGLPASFDPTIKPLPVNTTVLRQRPSEPSPLSTQASHQDAVPKSPAPPSTVADSDESDSEDEFEVMTGDQALDEDQQEKLHNMEIGEGAALLQQRRLSTDSTAVEEDDDRKGSTGAG